MTQARPVVRPNSRIWLLPAFLLIIAGFALGNLVVFVSTRKIQEHDRTIAKNAFVSIEAVSRLVHDIDEVLQAFHAVTGERSYRRSR